ncbi:hypothetical protein FAGAP_7778 [Fusarium agapanthi]|uniref:Heterokaryon incompatibility domain-containing protein n=1 Tax=Fusarium agapanthi TaxID=1803897 RepID=A0A9P5ECT5_9HYPO|nr:hypothetical protein FAGAP_7778 [Fusarium agapanthi]
MWLINTQTYKLENFVNPPHPYSILSHTWEGVEVLFQDMESLPYARSKAGWKKIQMTCEASRQANFSHTSIDTCCIDKRSSAELSEAINSMFAWYQQSSVCYAYLSDLVFPCSPVDTAMPKSDEGRQWADTAFSKLEDELRACRWFTRGWTLQELIAPSQVVFLDQNWNRIGSRTPGSDIRFIKILEKLTGIPSPVLEYKSDIATIPVAQRMSWAASRETTRIEDIAYCLLGTFDVNMPLLYGEGSKSFFRLQEEITKNYDDLSLFAWKQDSSSYGTGVLRGCFANSPAEFAHWLNSEIRVKGFESGMEVTSKNVMMDGRILRQEDHPSGNGQGVDSILDLGVRDPDDKNNYLGILLTSSGRSNTYFRFKPYELITLPPRRAFDSDDEFDDDYPSDLLDWQNEEALEGLEQKTISIRKSIPIQEARIMGHHQKPVFKIQWHEDVLKVLKSVNGRSTREFIPSFECHPSSAFHEDGTLTWITDFELQINPQHVVSLVLVTGLQWSPHNCRLLSYDEQASLHGQDFWAVLLGEGRAYVISKGAIHLGSIAKEITASLDAALRDIRDKSRVRKSHLWFRRVWVFQELVLSTDVWVQCDDLRIRWHHFCNAVDTKNVVAAMLLDTLSGSIIQQRKPRITAPLEDMNSKRYGAFEAPLYTPLSCRRGIGATDPRDIVFGHLSIVSDRDRCHRFIKVDYDRDLARVSVDAAQYFLDATGIESLLSHAMNPSSITVSGIPSWCPRWSRPQVPCETIHQVDRRFGGGGDSSYDSFGGTHHVLLSAPPVLAIGGFEVARIKTTSHEFSSCGDEAKSQQESKAVALELLQGIRLTCRHKSLDKHEAAILDSCKRVEARNYEQKQTLFRKSFKTWVDAVNTQESSRGDIQGIGDALIHYVMNPETSLLSGKSLTITSREHCTLISEESQEGDIVAKIVKCYKYAVLRPKEVNDVDHLINLITSAFEQANISDCPKGPTRAFLI